MPRSGPLPVTARPPSTNATVHPIRVRMSRSASPAWVVRSGQSRTVTVPPETAASARNGAALERSGSIARSTAWTGPGRTFQRSFSESLTLMPCSRSIATVISMWGSDGTGGPSWRTSTPSS
jgi:hypothetical protein